MVLVGSQLLGYSESFVLIFGYSDVIVVVCALLPTNWDADMFLILSHFKNVHDKDCD